MVFFSKKINFDVVFWPCLSHCRPFLTLFRPQIEVGFFSSHRDTRPPGLVKDHTFYGFFSATFPFNGHICHINMTYIVFFSLTSLGLLTPTHSLGLRDSCGLQNGMNLAEAQNNGKPWVKIMGP